MPMYTNPADILIRLATHVSLVHYSGSQGDLVQKCKDDYEISGIGNLSQEF